MIAFPEKNLFAIDTPSQFEEQALAVFRFQYEHIPVYRNFVSLLGLSPERVTAVEQIPFLPVEFFKHHRVYLSTVDEPEVIFTSSGTTGQITSQHLVRHQALYTTSFMQAFRQFYGAPSDYCILALLPSYLERSGSSLVYMADHLIQQSGHPLSGFFLHNYDDLLRSIEQLKAQKQKTILLGVSYALLDLIDKGAQLSDDFIVMETGGMKGKRKEMIKEEFYEVLRSGLGVGHIHSEYGMTELLSQAYSYDKGLYRCPPWMQVLIRDMNDPMAWMPNGKTGGINVIDLANVYSCAFIATKDLGKYHDDGHFEVLGRFDNSDLRGCNLMIG